jgi:hypothetical protein
MFFNVLDLSYLLLYIALARFAIRYMLCNLVLLATGDSFNGYVKNEWSVSRNTAARWRAGAVS